MNFFKSGFDIRKIALVFFLFFFAAGFACARERILVISTFHLRHSWTKSICDQVEKNFANGKEAYIVDYLELNAIRDRQGNFVAKFQAYLPQIKKGDYSMIVCILDDAINLVLKEYASIPKNVPIIFVGYQDLPSGFKLKYPNITGFGGGYDIKQSIDFMLSLYPQTKEIAVISDDLPSGLAIEENVRKINVTKGVNLININSKSYTSQQMIARVARMSKDSLVLFSPWRNFSKDGYASLELVAMDLSYVSNHPYFILTDVLFGKGAIGGYVVDGEYQGEALVKMMRDIINGKEVVEMSFEMVPTRCIIDMNLFRKEHLNISALPPETVMLNEKIPFYKAYPVETFFGVLLILVLCALIMSISIVVVKILRSRKLQMREIREAYKKIMALSQEQKIILNAVSEGLIVTDTNECVTMANAVAARISGYSIEEMIGKPLSEVFKLVSQIDGIKRPSAVAGVLGKGEAHPSGEHTNLITKQGFLRLVSDAALPVKNKLGQVIGAVLVFKDISFENEQRENTAIVLSALGTAAKLSKMSYRPIDSKGKILSLESPVGSFLSENKNWGYENGEALPAEKWVHPDDLLFFNRQWDKLITGVTNEIVVKYRSLYNGRVRYFVLIASLIEDCTLNAERRYSCVLQDVTERGETERKLVEKALVSRGIIDCISTPVAVKDAGDNFKYIIANKSFCETIGFAEEKIIGKTDYEIFDEASASHFNKDDIALLNGEYSVSEIGRIPNREGLNLYLHVTKTFLNVEGHGKFIVLSGSDVSEGEAEKRRAEENAELLKEIFDKIPVGLMLKDADDDFRYLMWNIANEKAIGSAAKEIIGKTDFECELYRDNVSLIRNQDLSVMENNTATSGIESRPTSSGERIYLTTKTPITLHTGKRYLLGSFIDFTEQKRLEKELQNSVNRLESLLKNERVYNDCLKAITLGNSFEKSIENSIATIGEQSGADICFIKCFAPAEDFTDTSFEWSRYGVESQIEVWKDFQNTTSPTFRTALETSEFCKIDRTNFNTRIYSEFKAFAGDKFRLESLLTHTIYENGNFWGVIGLASISQPKDFNKDDEEMIRNCGRLFMIAKQQAKQRVRFDNSIHIRRMVFNRIGVPIFLFNTDAKLISVNPAACALAKKTEQEILRNPCYLNYCGKACPPSNCPVRAALKSGKPESIELKFGDREMILKAEPITDSNGKILYILENAFDATEINYTTRKLKAAMKEAQVANRAKNNFISTMNHELRTPLNAVIGCSELLRMQNLSDAEKVEYIESINKSGRTLLNLVNDILDITKIDPSITSDFKIKKSDFAVVFADICEFFAKECSAKKLIFESSISSDIPPLYLNAVQLSRALSNVLSNAVKFTSIGKVKLSASFAKLNKEKGSLKIIVEDTGIGISADFIDHIYEPFVQDEHVRNSRAYQGSGLGLSVTKKLVDSMGGVISVSSCENVGSSFAIEFVNVRYQIPNS